MSPGNASPAPPQSPARAAVSWNVTNLFRYRLSWQITPVALTEAVTDPDPAVAKREFEAMMQMKKIDIAAIEAARRG